MSTAIQWTDVTDNIITVKGGGWWCRKISPGCANCYAAELNQNSFFGGNHLPYTGAPPALELKRDILDGWERQTKPKKHFVASMTDVFGEWVDVQWQLDMLDAMAAAPAQTFQVLTKHADVMRETVARWLSKREFRRVPGHIWLGVSVEDNDRRTRIGILKSIPSVRFLSIEPLLEDLPQLDLSEIDWVIVGGESGRKARPCEMEWIRRIVGKCKAFGVAFFVKQLGAQVISRNDAGFDGDPGEWPMDTKYKELDSGYQGAPVRVLLKDKKGGDMAEWPEDLRVRQMPGFEQEHPE